MEIKELSTKKVQIKQDDVPILINGEVFMIINMKYVLRSQKIYTDSIRSIHLNKYDYVIAKRAKLIKYINRKYEIYSKVKFYNLTTVRVIKNGDNYETISYIDISLPEKYYTKWKALRRDKEINKLLKEED